MNAWDIVIYWHAQLLKLLSVIGNAVFVQISSHIKGFAHPLPCV